MTQQQRQLIRQRIQDEFRFTPTAPGLHRDDEPQGEPNAPDLRSVDKDDPPGTLEPRPKIIEPNEDAMPRRRGMQIAEKNIDSILRDFVAGEPIDVIARRLHVSEDAIRYAVHRHVTPDQERQRKRQVRRKSPFCRAIACVERPELVFMTVRDAAEFLGRSRSAVDAVIDTDRKCGGYHWRRVAKREEQAA